MAGAQGQARARERLARRWGAALAALVCAGCGLIFPPRSTRTVALLPLAEQPSGQYEVRDQRVVFVTEGLRLEVEHLTDAALNELFGDESAQGRDSTNPYTYGDWIDPAVGYVRNRFTVFRVTVHNLSLGQVMLQPGSCRLVLEPGGQELAPYGLEAGSAPRTLEGYYRALRGPTGNDEYLFRMRMANARNTFFPDDQRVSRGETYAGMIVFDPLPEGVTAATLQVRDFVIRFNAYGRPLQAVDMSFRFACRVTAGAYAPRASRAASAQGPAVRLREASSISGQASGDLTREVQTIDAYVRTRLDDIGACFAQAFAAGTVSAGSVSVRYVILPHGGVERAEVVQSSLGNAAVEGCIATRVAKWRFSPVGGVDRGWAPADTTGGAAPPPPASGPVVVVSVFGLGEDEEEGR